MRRCLPGSEERLAAFCSALRDRPWPRQLGLDVYPAAKAFGVAVLAAAFFGGIWASRPGPGSTPAGLFAAELMESPASPELWAPVGGEAVNRFNVAEGAVQRTDKSFGGIGSQSGFGGMAPGRAAPAADAVRCQVLHPRLLASDRSPAGPAG